MGFDPFTMMLASAAISGGLSYAGNRKAGLTGSNPKFTKHSIMTGHDVKTKRKLMSGINQKDLDITQNPMYQQTSRFLQDLYSPNSQAMQAFSAPYMRQFNEEIIPQLSEQFAGADALSSSGFQQTLGKAGSGLMENLAALRGNMQMQGLPFMQQQVQQPFQNTLARAGLGLSAQKYAYGSSPGQPGALQGAAAGFAGAMPYLAFAGQNPTRQGTPAYGQQQFWNG